MSMMIMNLIIILALMFIFLNHPLSLGLSLLVQTILVTQLTGLMMKNYWFSYMMFLIMIGGMLILFIYMTSIASNEKFKFSPTLFTLFMFALTFTMFFLFYDNFLFDNLNNMTNQTSSYEFILSLTKFINSSLKWLFFMIISYLLITLIVVVKITDIQSGPLRQMN